MLPAVVHAQFNFVVNNRAVTITGYTGPGGAVSIPGTINGLPVTSIGISAFQHGTGLTSVTIPSSVTGIEDDAFAWCSGLTNVTIPSSVTNLAANDAFYGCTSLAAINVDGANPSYSSVNGVLFDKNQSTLLAYPEGEVGSYAIPSGVTGIGTSAFANCAALAGVTLPDTVASVGAGAFENCPGLSVLYFTGNSPTHFPSSFLNVSSATVYYLLGASGWSNTLAGLPTAGVFGLGLADNCYYTLNTSNGNTITIVSYAGSDRTVTFPTQLDNFVVTGIGNALRPVFSANPTNVTIPNSVVSIGAYAFADSGLASVTISDSVTNIGDYAFNGCSGLTSFTIPNSVVSLGDYAFAGTSLTSVTIPDSVTSIGAHTFADSSLTSLTLGSGVTHIGAAPFSGCGNLAAINADPNNPAFTSVSGVLFDKSETTLIEYPPAKAGTSYTIPGTVGSIGDSAFYSCTNLTYVTIPNSVTNIGTNAFLGCSSLTSVTIPNGVTSIGDDAFESCAGLEGVFFQGNAPMANATVFAGDNNVTVCYLPGTSGWSSTFAGLPTVLLWFTYTTNNDAITITGYPPIGREATIPSTINGLPVTSIGDSAFDECLNLTSVSIPDSVTNIGDSAFSGCTSLTAITIGSGVASIGTNAFLDCSSMASIVLPNSLSSIGDSAFDGCVSLTNVTIPDSVTNIGNSTFSGCTSLTEITIGRGVAGVGNSAFSRCSNLLAINVDVSNEFYRSVNGVLFDKGQDVLLECPQGFAGSYTIPQTVTSIGTNAFASCSLLTTVTIPNSVTNIEDEAFSACSSLTGVYFQGNAPNLGADVFDYPGGWWWWVFDPATVCYLPGTTGWGTNFAGLPTALWLPQIQTSDTSFGVRTNQFGFRINWASGMSVVVEASTSLSGGTWIPLQTNTFANGSIYFSDPQWANYPARFYRIRSP